MSEQTVSCVYYVDQEEDHTLRTIALAEERANALGIDHVVIASTSGRTGALAAARFGERLVVVSHSCGFSGANKQSMQPEYREQIEQAGAKIVTTTHALGGIGRAVRRKLSTYQVDEIIAFTLRNFCDGIKVACEISVMATDAGLVPACEEIIAIGGSGHGANAAAVIYSAHAQDFFDLRVLEILCKPR